jgi:hypothetical protein
MFLKEVIVIYNVFADYTIILSRMEKENMKTKFMLIISILLLVVAIPFLLKNDTHVIGTVLLMISMMLNLIRGLVNLWNERRLK